MSNLETALMNATLDKFGKFFVQNLRDRMLDDLEQLLSGSSKARPVEKLQGELAGFSEEQKRVVRDLAEEMITAGMHDLLFAIQEEADAGGAFKVLVDDQEVAKFSDGLQGEIFGEDGWIVRFSKHPSPAEVARSQWAKQVIAEKFGKKNDGAV